MKTRNSTALRHALAEIVKRKNTIVVDGEERKRYTQEQMARYLGTTQTTMCYILKGEREVSGDALLRLVRLFKIKFSELMAIYE